MNQEHAANDNDAEMLHGFISNDSAVVERVYLEHFQPVRAYILQNNGSEDDAKDTYQEAMVAAWHNARTGKFELRTGHSLGGYIFQIAKYKWLDKLKSSHFKKTIRLEPHHAMHEEELYSGKDDEELKQLFKLYSTLSDKCKAILGKYYFENKSLETIGQELGYEAGTVKTLKYRCMQGLRKRFLQAKP